MTDKIYIFVLLLFSSLLFLFGLWWLVIFLILQIIIYYKFIKAFKPGILKYLISVCIVFIPIIGAKTLTFDIFKIPSSSMENTLFSGDVIMVNKLKYGPRLPRSPFDIPFVNIAFYFNDNAKKRIKENWWSYKRLSGITNIKQGDIFVFNSTWSKQFILVKRCIGLPGDTLQIKNGTIYTNNNEFIEPRSVKNNYKFKAENKATLYKALDSFSNNVILKNSYNKFNLASLTASQLEHLKKQDYIDSVSIQIDTFAQKKLFVNLPSLQWGFDNMGPIIIPKKGMKIILNKETFAIYKRAINSSEGCKIEEIDGFYYIDSQKATYYTFKQDYYFMMGDNRKGTLDSRKWGFVPEENIIGKVQCVLYSNYGGEFNWSRLLKAVN